MWAWSNGHKVDMFDPLTPVNGGKTWDKDHRVAVWRRGKRLMVAASGIIRGDRILKP